MNAENAINISHTDYKWRSLALRGTEHSSSWQHSDLVHCQLNRRQKRRPDGRHKSDRISVSSFLYPPFTFSVKLHLRHKQTDKQTNKETNGQAPGIEFGAF